MNKHRQKIKARDIRDIDALFYTLFFLLLLFYKNAVFLSARLNIQIFVPNYFFFYHSCIILKL